MEVEVTPDFPAVGEAPAETAVLNDRGEFFFLLNFFVMCAVPYIWLS